MDSSYSNIIPDFEYDDGVVCFGPVTESQLERHRRLQRYTAIPTDFLISNSYFNDEGKSESEKDEKCNYNNDQSEICVNESKDTTIVGVDDSIDATRLSTTINFDNKENDDGNSSKHSPSSLTSPCASKFVPCTLLSTEVIERYMKTGTVLSDESSSEDRDISTFEDENVTCIDGKEEEEEISRDVIVCETDVQKDEVKAEVINDNSVDGKITSASKLLFQSVLSVNEELSNNSNENSSGVVHHNLCTLKYRSRKEESDESICSDSVLGDDNEDDSIVHDEFIITPGKQRLFDARFLKPSFNMKSGAFIKSIEETKTPVIPDTSISECVVADDTSIPLEIKKKLEVSLAEDNDISSFAVESSLYVKDTLSNNSIINVTGNTEKSVTVTMDAEPTVISDEEEMHETNLYDRSVCTSSFSVENNALNFDVVNDRSEKPSNVTKECLDFNQTQTTDNKDFSSFDINLTLNKTEDNCDQSRSNISVVEQTICSEISDLKKNDESFSTILASILKPRLSVIIENSILEEVDDEKKIDNDVSNNSVSKSTLNEETNNEMLIESTQEVITITENVSKSHVIEPSTINVSAVEKETNKTENNTADQSIIGSVMSLNDNEDTIGNITLGDCFLLENSGVSKNEKEILNEVENKLGVNTNEKILFSQNIVNDDWNLNNLTDISVLNTSELISRSEQALQNINNQKHALNTTNTMNESLVEFNKIEQMLFKEENKVFEFKTPKTQKLLDFSTLKKPNSIDSQGTQQLMDFSIVQQSPFLENQAKKQKLMNFSIVDQSPMSKTVLQTSFNENSTKADTLIDFSSVNQMWDLGVVPANEIDFQKSFSNSFLTISTPNVELLADKSIKTNSSNHSDLSFNQTITETNLVEHNNSINQQQIKGMEQLSEINNSTDKQIEVNKSSVSLGTAIASSNEQPIKESTTEDPKHESEHLINTNKSINQQQMKGMEQLSELNNSTDKEIEINKSSVSLYTTIASCNEQPIKASTTEDLKHRSEHLINTSNIGSVIDSSQQVTSRSKMHGIQDFSIIEESSESKHNENTTPAESVNVSNLIEMSVANMPSNKELSSSNIPIITMTLHEESEKTFNSSSGDANNTVIHFEDPQLVTDIQMNDVSLKVESPDKSSVSQSFCSIESNHHVQEDKKRKMEPTQACHDTEKKAKVDAKELETPTSMLYKMYNMFRSSEKKLNFSSNTKENDLKSGLSRQKLDFSKCNENNANIPMSVNYKKPELLGKSKIPCKVTDVSMTKNDGFNVSSSNDRNVINPKKTIPKFTGLSVLMDVSNSATNKCPENRHTPSRFQK